MLAVIDDVYAVFKFIKRICDQVIVSKKCPVNFLTFEKNYFNFASASNTSRISFAK